MCMPRHYISKTRTTVSLAAHTAALCLVKAPVLVEYRTDSVGLGLLVAVGSMGTEHSGGSKYSRLKGPTSAAHDTARGVVCSKSYTHAIQSMTMARIYARTWSIDVSNLLACFAHVSM